MKEIVGVEIFKRDIIGEILMNFLWRNIGTVNSSLKLDINQASKESHLIRFNRLDQERIF